MTSEDNRATQQRLADAVRAVDAEDACLTWLFWGKSLLGTPAGERALATLSGVFGPDYLHRQIQRPPAAFFDQSINPMCGPDRQARVLELAAWIDRVRGQPGWHHLKREARGDGQPSYVWHLRALLGLAAAFVIDGWTVDLHPNPTDDGRSTRGRAPDLRISRGTTRFAVEIKCLGDHVQLQETEHFRHGLRIRRWQLEDELGHGLAITCPEPCDSTALDEWEQQVREASVDRRAEIDGPSGGTTRLLFDVATGSTAGLALTGDLWGRLAMHIEDAARQLAHEQRGWIVLEDRGALAWATAWSRQPLTAKLDDIAFYTRRELSTVPHVAGVILTTGPHNTTGPTPGEDVPGQGCIALRRAMPGLQYRETFIVCPTTLEGTTRGLARYLPAADARALYTAYGSTFQWPR